MKIIHEEPGRRLELAEVEGRFSLPPLVIGLGLTALVAMPWRGAWAMLVHGAGRDTLDLVPSGIWLATGLLILLSLFGGDRLEGLCVDRSAGRLEWRRSHVLGLRACGLRPVGPTRLLVETKTFPNDASTPRLMTLPLARELAAALRAEVRETGPS